MFQFESGGMQDVLMKMKPDRHRGPHRRQRPVPPRPDGAASPPTVARKHGEKWTTPHPIMTEVLDETYGIMVYQEQVMQSSTGWAASS